MKLSRRTFLRRENKNKQTKNNNYNKTNKQIEQYHDVAGTEIGLLGIIGASLHFVTPGCLSLHG